MFMDGEMDDNALLKYVRFQILPNQNRFRAFACDGNKEESLVEGLLERLTQHLPQVKDFYVGGSEAHVILQWPTSSSAAAWFSKSTLRRFLNISNSTELFNEIDAFEDEMNQLEKARKFHFSLYSQSNEVEIISSDPSKNELLRAMDSRLKALREELAAVLEQAAFSSCSSKDISHLVNCCQALGAMALKNYIIKYSELNQIPLVLEDPSDEKPTMVNAVGCDYETKIVRNNGISNLSQPVVPVQYGGSPAKVAQAERDNTTDNDNSSEEDDGDVDVPERSRSRVRSATPRRSASPMRRVQIARVGSRRATAVGIKSLNYYPVRERIFNSREDEPANSSDEEVSEKPPRKPETNVQRMSVQATISLFESKQREDNADIHKNLLGDVPKNVKPVLRKWNSCIEQSHVQRSAEAIAEDHSFKSAANLQDMETQEANKPEPDEKYVDISHQDSEVEAAVKTPNSHESSALNSKGNIMATRVEEAQESTERQTASAKWNQQKEAELSMLMKMIQGKPVKQRCPVSNKNNTNEQRGGFYDDYKKKRDEKLREENAGKRAEKQSQLKATQQIIEKNKVEMPSKHGRRQSLPKPITSVTQPQSVNRKKESPKDIKPINVKRGASMPSSLPASRKSWPSTQPLQATGNSPLAKLPTGVASSTTATTRCKSQSPQSVIRPKPKAENPLLKIDAKGLPREPKASSNAAMAMHRQPWARDTKPIKPKSLASSDKFSDKIPAKTELHSKGVKQHSVVPVKSQPFLRKGSKASSAVVPTKTKSKTSPRSKETVRKFGSTARSQEKEEAIQSPEQVDKHEIKNLSHNQDAPALVSEIPLNIDHKTMDFETSSMDNADASRNLGVVGDPSLTFEKEETTVSPCAWVEVEESRDLPILPIPIDESEVQFAFPASVTVETTSPRMRQSLSQMLQEESNELENTEWGNAEHPTVFYPKDAPKGFKRLLKFARKSKGDGNSSGWSSPSVFSEADDDADDHKAALQRNSDSLLRKTTYQTKNNSQLKPFTYDDVNGKNSSGHQTRDIANSDQYASNQIGEGHNSTGVTSTKSSRSFFSLSAFKVSK